MSDPRDTTSVRAGSSQLLTGWGLTMPSRADVLAVQDVDGVRAALDTAGPRGILARGAGRSYGDAAQNGGGTVLDLTALDDVALHENGDVEAGAGVLLSTLVDRLLEHGRFLPVTPGTRFISVGGAVAADVHGKNHHRDGSFAAHLRWIDVVTGDGSLRRVGPDGTADDVELFDATTGGMGLTGVVVRARLATVPAPTRLMRVSTTRCVDLDTLMARMVEADASARYSVAWVDAMARGARLGRGVLTVGDHAEAGARRPRAGRSLREPRVSVPPVPVSPLNRVSLSAFNEAWFRRAPRARVGELQGIGPFFYPLDVVGRWNRLYGRDGFLQYQFVVPDAGAEVVRQSLERLATMGAPSFLTVLKRFGPGRVGSPLSFPIAGWTLAIDLPARVPGLASVLDGLDELVVAGGGRLYLAKDSRALPATIAAGYPELDTFRRVRGRVDPRGVFVSDLSRRLAL